GVSRAGVAGEGRDRLLVGSIRQPDSAVVASAGQGLAARAERHRISRVERAEVAVEGVPGRAAGGHIPQLDAAIKLTAGQGLAIRAERHRKYSAGTAR